MVERTLAGSSVPTERQTIGECGMEQDGQYRAKATAFGHDGPVPAARDTALTAIWWSGGMLAGMLKRLPWLLPAFLFSVLTPAKDAAAVVYQMAVGHQNGSTYALGVGVSSLIKVKTLPKEDIDLDTVITENAAASLAAMRRGEVQFALIQMPDGQHPDDPGIQAVAIVGREEGATKTLFASARADDNAVYEIVKTVFDNLPYLAAIDPNVGEVSLDKALVGLDAPLHPGAERYYAELWVTPPAAAETVSDKSEPSAAVAAASPQFTDVAPPAPAADAALTPPEAPLTKPANGNFVIYFDFDQATLDPTAEATLRRAVAFAESLPNPQITIAGYADPIGDPDYNYDLAARRAAAVTAVLQADLGHDALEVELFGEDGKGKQVIAGTTHASNRRVEVRIEQPAGPPPQGGALDRLPVPAVGLVPPPPRAPRRAEPDQSALPPPSGFSKSTM
jgi:outer membrane protein OmpA-like peptidoglycan-associated protein